MATGFAAAQSRLAASVLARLGNATATFGAESGDVILRRPDGRVFDTAVDVAAVMHCDAARFPGLARGDTLNIDGIAWRVVEAPLTASGVKRVALARA